MKRKLCSYYFLFFLSQNLVFHKNLSEACIHWEVKTKKNGLNYEIGGTLSQMVYEIFFFTMEMWLSVHLIIVNHYNATNPNKVVIFRWSTITGRKLDTERNLIIRVIMSLDKKKSFVFTLYALLNWFNFKHWNG